MRANVLNQRIYGNLKLPNQAQPAGFSHLNIFQFQNRLCNYLSDAGRLLS